MYVLDETFWGSTSMYSQPKKNKTLTITSNINICALFSVFICKSVSFSIRAVTSSHPNVEWNYYWQEIKQFEGRPAHITYISILYSLFMASQIQEIEIINSNTEKRRRRSNESARQTDRHIDKYDLCTEIDIKYW